MTKGGRCLIFKRTLRPRFKLRSEHCDELLTVPSVQGLDRPHPSKMFHAVSKACVHKPTCAAFLVFQDDGLHSADEVVMLWFLRLFSDQ